MLKCLETGEASIWSDESKSRDGRVLQDASETTELPILNDIATGDGEQNNNRSLLSYADFAVCAVYYTL